MSDQSFQAYWDANKSRLGDLDSRRYRVFDGTALVTSGNGNHMRSMRAYDAVQDQPPWNRLEALRGNIAKPDENKPADDVALGELEILWAVSYSRVSGTLHECQDWVERGEIQLRFGDTDNARRSFLVALEVGYTGNGAAHDAARNLWELGSLDPIGEALA